MTDAADRLAEATGRPAEAFESDAPLPALEDLESVGTVACPVDDCDAGPWPDTHGADGGRRARVLHLYRDHGDGRGRPINKIERL